jgi:MmyB-like transcription regulator ligand binding domain
MEVTMALPLTSTPTCSSRPAVAVKVHIVPASGHRVRWAAHDVQFHRTGVKRFHHPLVRDLTVSYEALALPADARLTIFAYTGEPNSPSHHAVNLLANWTSTPNQASAVPAEEEV